MVSSVSKLEVVASSPSLPLLTHLPFLSTFSQGIQTLLSFTLLPYPFIFSGSRREERRRTLTSFSSNTPFQTPLSPNSEPINPPLSSSVHLFDFTAARAVAASIAVRSEEREGLLKTRHCRP